MAQCPKRHLELARIECVVFAEIAIVAFARNRHCRAEAAFSADADAVRVPAAVAEGASSAGAHPVGAAVVFFGLLLQALFEHLEQILQRLFREAHLAQFFYVLQKCLFRFV